MKADARDTETFGAVTREAGRHLRGGEVVAFPTETVYGLGADALNEAAVAKIFVLKGRPADNPLIIHIADLADLERVAEWTPSARKLAEAFWPGPLTMVLPKKAGVLDIVSAGLPTVGVRFPAHPVALGVIKAAGRPIAAPSANLSGRPSPTLARHVVEDFGDEVMVVDGGATEVGLESTVVDVSGERPVILRPGFITGAEIGEVLGEEVGCSSAGCSSAAGDERPAAPGMKYKHYAPKGEVRLAGNRAEILEQGRELEAKYGERPLCIVMGSADEPWPDELEVFLVAGRGDLEAYARNIFAALRYADANNYAAVVVEAVPEEGLGVAIMDRLKKAAGGG
ncbi:L-threonylcarbamoyladenylate synthase [Candidatus Saccharibacteria bacterium]|nr:L-threonylcarbamoyladenylate synthase [Candidatus Saccharibacteria bacterium]